MSLRWRCIPEAASPSWIRRSEVHVARRVGLSRLIHLLFPRDSGWAGERTNANSKFQSNLALQSDFIENSSSTERRTPTKTVQISLCAEVLSARRGGGDRVAKSFSSLCNGKSFASERPQSPFRQVSYVVSLPHRGRLITVAMSSATAPPCVQSPANQL